MTSVSITVTESGRNARVFDLGNDFSGTKSLEELLEFTRRAQINIAKEVLKEEQSRGFDKKPRVRVDNVFGRREEQVRYFGKIEYFAKVDISLALLQMYDLLVERSPIVTGQYRSGNLVFVNGQEVARSKGGLRRYVVSKASEGGFKANDEIRFINVNPYARRLEKLGVRRGTRGKFAGQNQIAGGRRRRSRATGDSIKQPNGAYYLSYRVFRNRFRQIAEFMRFSFMPNGTNGIFVKPAGNFRTSFKKDGRPYLYPSIVIKLSGEGIKGEQTVE